MARLTAALLALTGVAATASSGSGAASAPPSSIVELDTESFADAVRAGDMLVEL
jgi:hypothetical protein